MAKPGRRPRVAVKTDNSFFEEKVRLRADNLPPGEGPIRILDLYSGNGLLWAEVARRTPRPLEILRVDKAPGKTGIYLQGDNRKFPLDYRSFDIVDLDAYGAPFDILSRLLSCPPRWAIFITWIQSGMGQLPKGFLSALGYMPAMVRKIPALFNRRGQDKLFSWLALHGATSVDIYHTPDNRKNYLCILTKNIVQ
jgi:hypothetical protein